MKKKNGKIIIAILVAIVTLGIGYASITAIPLIINGSAVARGSARDEDFIVHFDNFLEEEKYITYNELTGTGDSMSETYISPTQVTAESISTTKSAGVTVSPSQDSATIAVSNLTNVGDTVTIKIPIINESDGIKANLSTNVINNNEEYFTVTSTPGIATLDGGNAKSYVTVTVLVKKVPKVEDVTGTFSVTLTAEPTE